MDRPRRYTDYDHLAWFYDRYWGDRFLNLYGEVVRDMFVARVKKGEAVLDLACGPGRICHWLTELGLKVTGLDGSRRMLAIAGHNAPKANFLCRDMRTFQIVGMFRGVLCTQDSLNHLATIRELGLVFNNVYSSMKSGGQFVFDISTEDGLRARYDRTLSFIDNDHVLAGELNFDEKAKTVQARYATFRYQRRWSRRNTLIKLRAFSRADVEKRLAKSFFKNVRCFDAQRGFKSREVGRLFFICEK